MKRFSLVLSALLCGATPLLADSDSLLIGNADYGLLSFLSGGVDIGRLDKALSRQGVSTTAAQDANAAQMRRAFARFVAGIDSQTTQVAVVLAGRFASGAGGAYLLPVDTNTPMDAAEVLTQAFPLDAVMSVLAAYPGRALLVLGEAQPTTGPENFVHDGAGQIDIPQGVTVIRGPLPDAARFLRDAMAVPGVGLLGAARQAGLKLEGYVPQEVVFLEPPVVVPGDDGARDTEAADNAAWKRAVAGNSDESYSGYLDRFPDGLHAAEATQRLDAIRSDPYYREKQVEAALGLSRDDRREIQRHLSLLGYNTRGIDGIFGRGTRGALARWQRANRFPATGYLDSIQITRLTGQAERRAAQLEEEARQRQLEQERLDRAYWEETGAHGDEPGLRAYLEKYPDGIFAELAQERLDAIEARQSARAEARDRVAWQEAKSSDVIRGYQLYLHEWPNGAFADQARARIEELERSEKDRALLEQAKAEEERLGLNRVARRLAEMRLAQLGLRPGEVDGNFDKATRRAIRRYQDARKLRVTGYLDQSTVVRLMADSILR